MVQSSDSITLSVADTVATIKLNRPSVLNAIDAGAARAFLSTLKSIADCSDVRAIVLRGEGRAFCAGGDVSRFGNGDPEAAIDEIITPFHEALQLLNSLPQPSVAAVHGAAAGAGFSLALACDFAIATETAKFTLAYARIGASPDGAATYHLPRIVGLRKAKELALLADTIDAAEALRLGLVNRVVPEAEFDSECARLATRLAAGPSTAYHRIRELLTSSFNRDLDAQLEAERQAFKALSRTQDFREGVSAFLNKIPAQFKGH
ncbi:enoyl-CoA hydratase/isomerase family protein [Microvirga sp. KLBC 81]|uniref:enoyl-CoA hydratase/isomerase family protein n=1 Tax=Microvirga sp. KLBC 81 TaxID=1862707 RepID=UPI001FE21A7E|nr:enoyl-CoA hydratase-related protein [Microvirga sp. KLBC 81]